MMKPPLPLRTLGIVLLACALGLGLGYLTWGRNGAAQEPTLPQALASGGDSWGAQNAPITIVEFGDYEDPFSRNFQQEIWPKLKEAFPNQIRLVFRDFPLIGIHPNAAPAAEAARCASEQGKFWAYHDLLFGSDAPLGSDTYVAYASQLKLDLARFQDCLSSGRGRQLVRRDFADAATLGLNATPTFFINGLRLEGVQTYEGFLQIIEQIVGQP